MDCVRCLVGMTRNGAPDTRLITDYLAGVCTAEECTLVEAWAAQTPRQRQHLENLRRIWQQASERTQPSVNLDALIHRINDHVAMHPAESPGEGDKRHTNDTHSHQNQPKTREGGLLRNFPWLPRSIAAFVSVSLLVAGLLFWGASRTQPTQASYATGTANGQQAKVSLPDGTIVTLNVASKIDIPNDFGQKTRTVHLRGEAYFQVQANTQTPFVVQAANTRTTVLGTEFGVRAYQGDAVQVAVRSGKVAVNNRILGANDIAHVTAQGDISLLKQHNLDAALGFADGRLMLNHTRLQDAIPQLERWYDVEIRVTDARLSGQRLTATLLNNSIGELVELLEVTFNARVDRNGKILTVSPL